MWSSRKLILNIATVVLFLTIIPDFILALRNVSVTIPLAVKRGDNAILICNYDIENDTLYTVKWYRGRREFYRYTPKENPAWKIFASTNGLSVDTTQSNASHVFLRNVSTSITGRYACEVSADAPSFHTSIMWGEMDVIELPTQRPIITGIHSRYRLGDVINGNCSSDYSKPAANLTWWINDIQVPPNYLRTSEIQQHIEEQLETSVLEINFIVTLQHFIKGRLKLKCSARIHRIYHAETEKHIEEDRPRILASGRSPDTLPYDHNDEFADENGFYLTHNTNNHSSAQSTLINFNGITRFIYTILATISSLFFIIFNNNILGPLGCERQHQQQRIKQKQKCNQQQQIEQQPSQQQFATSFLQNPKTKPLQQYEHQQQQQQKHQYCYINCLNKNYNDHYEDNDNNNNNNADKSICKVVRASVSGKIMKEPTLKSTLGKSEQKKPKNEFQTSHACKSGRHVKTIAKNKIATKDFAAVSGSVCRSVSIANILNAIDMRHVLR